jgi:nicotinamide mononucleotide (NMN) deamidase PncC
VRSQKAAMAAACSGAAGEDGGSEGSRAFISALRVSSTPV